MIKDRRQDERLRRSFDHELRLACRALRGAIDAARAARVITARDAPPTSTSLVRAALFWCSIATKHLEQAISLTKAEP